MKKTKLTAFTLVELIVVITILSILGTIAFISLSGYGRNARNSNRISDVKTIEKALSIFITSNTSYPEPDNATDITYSGGLAWTQGTFSSGVLKTVRTISNIPLDPLSGNEYTYSLLNTKNKYQLATVLEGGLLSYDNSVINSSYAMSSGDLTSYNLGNYISRDVKISNGGVCSFISAPSIILSDIPPSSSLSEGGLYSFSFTKSPNIPSSYSNIENSTISSSSFQVEEVLSSCNISTISELELYIAQLATAYQSLAPYDQYEELIYNFNSIDFKRNMSNSLIERGIEVDQSIISFLKAPEPEIVFSDIFLGNSGNELIGAHTPNSPGTWNFLPGGFTGSYIISGNKLVKNNAFETLIYPVPNPIITENNYGISFNVEGFGGGTISTYLRYTDSNNYYGLDITASGYVITRKIASVVSTLQVISDPINIGDRIKFSVSGDTITLVIGGIEKESILAGGVDAIGFPLVSLVENGASIGNYTLTYK